jgi:large subunit ribosomal protein L15
MKLHDLRPAPGAHKKKTRVGRGIAAGQGKTAGRGTKGQKARAGGGIPAWFEGGQTPLHQRIPKLRGFKNPFKVDYEIVNVGDISRLVELGILEPGDMPGAKKAKETAPITVNQEILRAAGLVRTLNKPMKVLGNGDLSTALFVVADAVSGSARTKIEGAGGTVSILEVPKGPKAALGLAVEADGRPAAEPAETTDADSPATAESKPPAPAAAKGRSAPAEPEEAVEATSPAARPAKAPAGPKATARPKATAKPKAATRTKASSAPADEAPAEPSAESEAAPTDAPADA